MFISAVKLAFLTWESMGTCSFLALSVAAFCGSACELVSFSSCRDLVHRQTASAVVQHMSLGVYGFGCEDSLNHLLNYVWPNVFETSPHVIQAVMGALEGLRVALGPCRMLQYCLQVGVWIRMGNAGAGVLFLLYLTQMVPTRLCLQGLFHPARKVRDVYWKIYNSIYIGSQDALIAHYPQVYNDEKNVYVRYELEYAL